ncbi:hypothetical protein CSHISOI_04085 [Colletotrichum shisoi]|uniref:Uncharacterized protein n=1 Tax=Colletotrichum shisoi TaxID=2078593 RepID=A0A5Q4BXU0_9PEZI|nr:hypothetical protein CSHISOI_04085 [Colletotrichum shisoi]
MKLLNALLLLLQAGPLVLCATLGRRDNGGRGDHLTEAEIEASRIMEEPYNPVRKDGSNTNDPFNRFKYKESELLLWDRRAVELDARESGPGDAESATGPPPTKETSSDSDLGRGVEGAEVPESVERDRQEAAFGFETGQYSVPGEVAAGDFV